MNIADNVIRFPLQLRVVCAPADEGGARSVHASVDAVLVDHDGRSYRLDALLAQLPASHTAAVQDAAPRSGQEAWDLVVRRWPLLAISIVAGVHPV